MEQYTNCHTRGAIDVPFEKREHNEEQIHEEETCRQAYQQLYVVVEHEMTREVSSLALELSLVPKHTDISQT